MTKQEFLKDITNWSSHRHLLWPALEATKHLRLPVMELGAGKGSTPYLMKYCADNGLEFLSYDFSKEWAEEMGSIHVTDWANQVEWKREYSVVLCDESPGEHRKESLRLLTETKVIVLHDSEPLGWNGGDYRVRPLFKNFKYFKDHTEPKPHAWATALSNTIDVSKW